MKKVYFLIGMLALLGLNAASAKDWYLIGSFCNWDEDQEIKMTQLDNGNYTVTVPSIQGEFKFRADKSWNENLGALNFGFDDITGSGFVQTIADGLNFKCETPLQNVTFTLIMNRKTLKVSGPSSSMPRTPMAAKEIGTIVKLNSDGEIISQEQMKEAEPGVFTATISSDPDSRYIFSSVLCSFYSNNDNEVRRNFLKNYQYGKQGSAASLEIIDLGEVYPFDFGFYNEWSIDAEGIVDLILDTNTKSLKAEQAETSVYICGKMENADGVSNDFTPPSENNREFYDNNFRLEKIGNVYCGTYYFAPADAYFYGYSKLSQFRFFTALLGWTKEASLGSVEDDYYCIPVYVTDGVQELPMVKQGLGNWAPVSSEYKWNGGWVSFEVDLDSLTLKMVKVADGIDQVSSDNSSCVEEWYTIQGYKIDKPVKGLNINVRTGARKRFSLRNNLKCEFEKKGASTI